MTAPRDTDRLIRAFLHEGGTELPDRAFDAVRSDIHRTRQRVVIGPWREPDMSNLARVAIAAAAVIAVGFAWVNFGPSQSPGVAGRPTPSPSVSPSPSAGAAIQDLATFGSIPPGRYRLARSAAGTSSTPRLVVTLPKGWTTEDSTFVFKNGTTDGLGFGSWIIDGTVVDPCTDHRAVTPKPSGIDALAQALTHQPKTTATPPTDVTIDGYRGKVLDVTVATDISKCGNGVDSFWLWTAPDGFSRWVQHSDETNRIWILDVDGQRFTFNARIPARTTAADRAELEAMIQSLEIEPRT